MLESIHPQMLRQLRERAARCSELERLAADVVAELRRLSSEASMHSYSAGYHDAAIHEMALAQAYESAADLVAKKLGVKP